jgi:hypothetical protein
MNPRVKYVYPKNDYIIEIIFSNNEKKYFDIKPYLNFGIFQDLKNEYVFNTVKASCGTAVWNNGIDICPDTLYLESRPDRVDKVG